MESEKSPKKRGRPPKEKPQTREGLTPKQSRFIDEYLVDLNGTQAAIRAGYSPNSANEQASALLAKPNIRSLVDQLMAERAARTRIDADYVLDTIHSTVERCRQAEPVVDREGRPTGEYRFDAPSVLKGAELLGKHVGMFKDRLELSGPNGGPIEVQLNAKTIRKINEILDGSC